MEKIFLTLIIIGQFCYAQNKIPADSTKTEQQLQEVTIFGKINNHNYATKIPLKNIENPQFVSTVNHQIIVEQNATDISSILKNIPGIVKSWSSIAGYYTSRGFNTRNYIRNGVSGYVTADVDIANIEKVEAIKGPSGTLFGSTLASFGGLLNRITKKPNEETKIEIGYQGGSYDLNRFTADINTPLNKGKKVFFRINASQHYEGSFQDAGFVKSTFFAPSIAYQINDKLSINLDAEFYERSGTSLTQISPTGSGSDNLGSNNPNDLEFIDYKKSYSNNSIVLKNPSRSFYGQINYKLNNQWSSQTNVIRINTESTGNYLNFNLLKGDVLLVRNVSNYPNSLFTITQIQQNIINEFEIKNFKNKLLLGAEYYQNNNSSSVNALNGRGGRPSFDTLDLQSSMPNYTQISPSLIDSKLEAFSPLNTVSNQETFAVYGSNIISFSETLSLLLSLRIDRFINKGTINVSNNITSGNYNQTSYAPKLGIVYQIIKNRLSLFGNYNNGFQNVAPFTQPDGSMSDFKPQYANQLEGGIKLELANEKLVSTLSFYSIKVTNSLRLDSYRPNFRVQDGTQFSKGIEVDIFSRPFDGLLINTGFAYNDSKLTSGDITVNGLRPINSGPEYSSNFYASYTFPFTRLNGFGVGFGGNYIGRNYIINNTNSGEFYLNSYALLNASIFYSKTAYRFGLNIDNLTNKQFYTGGFGYFTPGNLRRVIASLILKF
jgi:iron complex outermembrane receptor protein